MKPLPLLGLLLGGVLVAVLLATNDLPAIGALVIGAGWGVLAVIALHVPQTVFSALAWRPLIDARAAPPLGRLVLLRWVREAVNALLPVAQIGGDIVRGRLLARSGVPLAPAAASCTVDLAVEMVSQIVFSLAGLAVLFAEPGSRALRGPILAVMAVAALIAVSFTLSQRFGLFRLVEPWTRRLGRGRPGSPQTLTGLHEAVVRLYRDPRRIATSGLLHLVSWVLGAVETWEALSLLHLSTDWRAALVIESLGQAIRGLGFLIPGALGVQEGGYILICALFGVAAPGALALSLVRRLRELTLGLPGLLIWRRFERSPAVEVSAPQPVSP